MAARSFKTRLVLQLAASLVGGAAVLAAASGWLHYRSLKQSIQQKLIAVATAAAAFIDVDAHERLRTPEDMQRPEYKAMVTRLNRLLAATPSLKFIYTLRPDGGSSAARTWRFVLDGGSAGTALNASNPDFSSIGDAYDKLPRHAQRVLRTRVAAADDEPLLDQWGWMLSAYAPLVDRGGRAVGLVGVDMTADELAATMARVYRFAGLLFAAAAALAAALAAWIAAQVMRPIDELRAAAGRVAAGDLTRPIATQRDDEFGDAFAHFNGMMVAVRQAQALVAQKVQLTSQLELAASVQNQLLSWPKVTHPAVGLFHHNRTAERAGGDWAQFHLAGGRWLYLLCGDVAGHGVAPAMVSATVAGAFETVKLDIEAGIKVPAVGSFGSSLARRGAVFGIAELVRSLNRVVLTAGQSKFPMTMFVLLVDLETGFSEYACAGHPSARIVRFGGPTSLTGGVNPVRLLRGRSDFLGYDDTLRPDVRTQRLRPGDTVVVYSDGLTDRRDSRGRFYGSRRLDRVLTTHAPDHPETLCSAIVQDTVEFAGGEYPADDVTVMVIHFKGPAAIDEDDDEAPLASAV